MTEPIKLLVPMPRYMDSCTAKEFDRRIEVWAKECVVAAIEADRQVRGNADASTNSGEPLTAEPVRVPSDAELEKAWDSFEAEMARHPTDDELEEFMSQFADEAGHIHDDQHAEAARALLARFGQTAQPNVPEPLKYGGAWKDHYVTGWNNCRAAMLEAAQSLDSPEPKGKP